jgi:hypothetical protein
MVGSGRRTPTGTIRAGEVDAAHNRMRCQRREQRFTMEQTLGLPRMQYGAARFAYVRWSAPNGQKRVLPTVRFGHPRWQTCQSSVALLVSVSGRDLHSALACAL